MRQNGCLWWTPSLSAYLTYPQSSAHSQVSAQSPHSASGTRAWPLSEEAEGRPGGLQASLQVGLLLNNPSSETVKGPGFPTVGIWLESSPQDPGCGNSKAQPSREPAGPLDPCARVSPHCGLLERLTPPCGVYPIRPGAAVVADPGSARAGGTGYSWEVDSTCLATCRCARLLEGPTD